MKKVHDSTFVLSSMIDCCFGIYCQVLASRSWFCCVRKGKNTSGAILACSSVVEVDLRKEMREIRSPRDVLIQFFVSMNEFN